MLPNKLADDVLYSALDIFGGSLVKFDELVEENRKRAQANKNA